MAARRRARSSISSADAGGDVPGGRGVCTAKSRVSVAYWRSSSVVGLGGAEDSFGGSPWGGVLGLTGVSS